MDNETLALTLLTDSIHVMSTTTTAAGWRALATGHNVFDDAVYLERADEIEASFAPGEYI